MPIRYHKTRIVATIGPASDVFERQVAMIRAGMDVARLNFSHGEFEDHGRRIESLRRAAQAAGREVAILADLPGPKIRLGELAREPIELETGAAFTLTTLPIVGDGRRASVGLPTLPEKVRPGDRLFVNDGFVQLEVISVDPPEILCRVSAGGEIRSRKGLNFPGIDLGLAAFTDHDRACLEYALSRGVAAVSQSFVESAEDVLSVRRAAAELGHAPLVVAKIERARALEKVDEILQAADAIMIARGDLGVEVPIERMAILQKELIRKAVQSGKPVITATQMLESMTRAPQPTRAEATDVANAILDGTDAIMLSEESATGRYPSEAVATLARIAAATEPHRPRRNPWDRLGTLPSRPDADPADLLALAVEAVLAASPAAVVVVPTLGGYTARSLARLRLPIWIAALTGSGSIGRKLLFSYGIEPVPPRASEEDWGSFTRALVEERGLVGTLALLIQGPSPARRDIFHRLELLPLPASTRGKPVGVHAAREGDPRE